MRCHAMPCDAMPWWWPTELQKPPPSQSFNCDDGRSNKKGEGGEWEGGGGSGDLWFVFSFFFFFFLLPHSLSIRVLHIIPTTVTCCCWLVACYFYPRSSSRRHTLNHLMLRGSSPSPSPSTYRTEDGSVNAQRRPWHNGCLVTSSSTTAENWE